MIKDCDNTYGTDNGNGVTFESKNKEKSTKQYSNYQFVSSHCVLLSFGSNFSKDPIINGFIRKMDYKEEQQNEIDALDSIYCGEMTIIGTDPYYQFEIPVKSDEFDSDQHDIGLSCCLKFEYVEKYPDEPPIIEVEDVVGFEDQEDELKDYLVQQSQENVGMVMIFTLVSAAQDWMNNFSDSEKQRKQDDDDKRREKEMEAELKRFEGTKVTVESFLRWKFNFEEDMGVLKKRNEDEKNKKLTGRELFMTDKSLNESDLKFLEEGDSVKVDESLFEEIEDLEIGDAESSDDS